MVVHSALGRRQQEDHKFQGNLGYKNSIPTKEQLSGVQGGWFGG